IFSQMERHHFYLLIFRTKCLVSVLALTIPFCSKRKKKTAKKRHNPSRREATDDGDVSPKLQSRRIKDEFVKCSLSICTQYTDSMS
ncbi:hypothetical protein L9F63_028267, partial [Diploptera punctata]